MEGIDPDEAAEWTNGPSRVESRIGRTSTPGSHGWGVIVIMIGMAVLVLIYLAFYFGEMSSGFGVPIR